MFLDLKNKKKIMTDPRFFRRYLDILDEQPSPTTVNVGDNTTATVDTAAKTIGMQTKVGDTDIKATQDFSTAKAGAGQVSVDAPIAPGTTAGATYTQTGFKGQMTPTSQVRMSHKDTDVGEIDTRVDYGAMFQGSGKNAQQGNPAIVTDKVTNPQGQTATYNTNRNL